MGAHNVLCNSYNSRDKLLQLSSCTFCVVLYHIVSYSVPCNMYTSCVYDISMIRCFYHKAETVNFCQYVSVAYMKQLRYSDSWFLSDTLSPSSTQVVWGWIFVTLWPSVVQGAEECTAHTLWVFTLKLRGPNVCTCVLKYMTSHRRRTYSSTAIASFISRTFCNCRLEHLWRKYHWTH
jgi:hypothetical protein